MVKQTINLQKQTSGINLNKSNIDLNKSQIDLNKSNINLVKDNFVKPQRNPIFNFLKDNAQFIRDNSSLFFSFSTDVQEGLVPIGNNLWATRDEPISPFDCDAYPDSPYCGGNPINIQNIGDLITQLASLNINIVVDECNIGIEFNPVVGYISLPQFQIVYRDPNCPVKDPEPDPSMQLGEDDIFIPPPPGTKDNGIYIVDFEATRHGGRYIYSPGASFNSKPIAFSPGSFTYRHTGIIIGKIGGFRLTFKKYNPFWSGVLSCWCKGTSLAFYGERDPRYLSLSKKTRENIIQAVAIARNDRSGYSWKQIADDSHIGGYKVTGFVDRATPRYDYYFGYPYMWDAITEQIYGKFSLINIIDYEIDKPLIIRPPNPPPPILPLPDIDPMACCPEHTQLLKSLLAKVNKLSEIVGVDEYPASLPESLISKDEGFLGNLIPNPNVEIKNLTQFFAWYVERFDELMGQFEIPVEVKDSDPTTPGEQPAGFKLPNVAESIGELAMIAFQTMINTETVLNIVTRVLIESGQDKTQNFITYKLLLAMTDWAGFKTKDVPMDLPMTFNPGKTKFDELLQETNVKVSVSEFDEKFGLEAKLMRFGRAAAILDALHYKKVNPFGDVSKQIVDNLKNSLNTAKKLNEEEEESFEQFLQDAEDGFRDIPGLTNPEKPYGKDYTERPRIVDRTKPNDPSP